jgi:hypothetical protein
MEGSLVAYKVFSNGSVLNASEINDNLMNQSVIVFSNSAARTAAITSPVDGMLTYLEDTDVYQSYTAGSWITVADGTGWTTFTPSWTSFTPGNGVYNFAKYKIIGKTAIVAIDFTLGTTSAVTGDINIALPTELVRINGASNGLLYGNFRQGVSTNHLQIPLFSGNTARIALRCSSIVSSRVQAVVTSSTVPHTWSSGDGIQFGGTWEIA